MGRQFLLFYGRDWKAAWNTMNKQEELKKKLGDLRLQHRELDDAIAALQASGGQHDHLQIQRLKKQKLALKDQIAKLESALVPDIIA